LVRQALQPEPEDSPTLEPNRDYQVQLTLLDLRPGQFQGLFFENVEPEQSNRIQ